jgi:hypothetical protein
MAVDAATDVNLRLGIHTAKCIPKSKPALIDVVKVFLFMFLNPFLNAKGAVATAPKKHRQNAIAIAGAAVTVINGPDVEMANIAIARITKSMENLLFAFVNFI